MKRTEFFRKKLTAAVNLLITVLLLNACTARLQQRKPLYDNGKILSLNETIALPKGSKIRIRFKDGSVKWGRYLGYRKLPYQDYLERYNNGKKEVGKKIVLPAIHETINVKMIDDSDYFAEFLGFDLKTMRIRILDEPEEMNLPVKRINNITDVNGYQIEKRVLQVLTRFGEIPYASILIFREKNKPMAMHIGIEKIVHVQYIRQGNSPLRSKLEQSGLIILPAAALIWLSMRL